MGKLGSSTGFEAKTACDTALNARRIAADATAGRREFLKSLAMVGAGTFLSEQVLTAQTKLPDSDAPSDRIDVHHHILPPAYMLRLVTGFSKFPTEIIPHS